MNVSFGKVYYFPTQTVSNNNSQLILDSLRRYLQASKWKTQVAIQRLESTLKWRRDYGLYDYLTSDLISIEVCQISFFLAWTHMIPFSLTILKGETGKLVVFGFDIKGRPIFYMIPSRQNTEESPRQMQYTVWLLERCIDLMPPGTEYVLSSPFSHASPD